MIIADKIIKLRKKNGWSQEELAEKMEVSRQAVSKWESSGAVPDLGKVLKLSSLFGVTTDYLLKDEIEDEEFTDECNPSVKRIALAQAKDFLLCRKSASVQIALGTFLCIISPIPLLILGAAAEVPSFGLSENLAAGIGLITLLILVAAAVAIFISCGAKNAPFEFIDREPFETEYGVSGFVRESQNAFKGTYTKCNVIAACLCILSPIPLFAGAFTENPFLTVVMLTVTMLIAGIGAVIFNVAGVRQASMQKLLQESEYTALNKKNMHIRTTISTVYWLTATAVYLGWSFWSNDWKITWIVWPIAAVMYPVIMYVYNLISGKDSR